MLELEVFLVLGASEEAVFGLCVDLCGLLDLQLSLQQHISLPNIRQVSQLNLTPIDDFFQNRVILVQKIDFFLVVSGKLLQSGVFRGSC